MRLRVDMRTRRCKEQAARSGHDFISRNTPGPKPRSNKIATRKTDSAALSKVSLPPKTMFGGDQTVNTDRQTKKGGIYAKFKSPILVIYGLGNEIFKRLEQRKSPESGNKNLAILKKAHHSLENGLISPEQEHEPKHLNKHSPVGSCQLKDSHSSNSHDSCSPQSSSDVSNPAPINHPNKSGHESELPELDDNLSDSSVPPPFYSRLPTPDVNDFVDLADYFMDLRFAPMPDAEQFISVLNKRAPKERSTEELYSIAEKTQHALKLWQDEYLKLDYRTAPHAHPPKKVALGGRVPLDPAVAEDMKEADLYSFQYDPKRAPGHQDPFSQRLGCETVGGRELRQRRTGRDIIGDTPTDEEPETQGRPKRRVVTRPGAPALAGRAYGRGVKRTLASEVVEVNSDQVRKRGRIGCMSHQLRNHVTGPAPQRLSEKRDGSTSKTKDEEGEEDNVPVESRTKRRGRPPGSKNLARRSDAGVKKGPRNDRTSRTPLKIAIM